jgi:muramoyltetrapeptide carboxypeptidase
MLKPRRLEPGDRLAVVAPASPFEREEFDRGTAELRRLGFEPVFDERVFDRRGYVAGEPFTRAKAIVDAWRNPTISGLVSARGGYGSVHLLPLLDPAEARRARKVFVGFSDVTSILVFLSGECGLVTVHGPMVAHGFERGNEGYDEASFTRVTMRAEPIGELSSPNLETLRPGEVVGPLHGGTLTQLLASLGTPYAFSPPQGCVLFLDEVRERPYRLDRMLTQLRLSGLLSRAAAIVLGELPLCDEPGGPTARSVVADLLGDFPGPVLFGFPSGHTAGPMTTLPIGVQARVVANGSPALHIEESAVEP